MKQLLTKDRSKEDKIEKGQATTVELTEITYCPKGRRVSIISTLPAAAPVCLIRINLNHVLLKAFAGLDMVLKNFYITFQWKGSIMDH